MPPICVKCEVQMRCQKNGKPVELMASDGPYQLWMGDMWRCPQCQTEIVSGFGRTPLAEVYQSEYRDIRASYEASDGSVVQCWSTLQEKKDAGH